MKIITEYSPWTKRAIRARCVNLRTAAERRGLSNTDELDAYWPGGAENTEPGIGGWIYCYASYVRIMGRDEDGSGFQKQKRAKLEEALTKALSSEGERVRLTDGSVKTVHPKSYHALRYLDFLDRTQRIASEEAAREIEAAEDVTVAALAPLVESLAVREWAWVLCDPAPALPFPDEGEHPEPPEWTRSLTPEDILGIAKAHVQVNHARNALISAAFPGEKGGESGLSLAGFIGVLADEKNLRANELMRNWPLGELFAQRVVAAQAAREAREQSKAKAGAA